MNEHVADALKSYSLARNLVSSGNVCTTLNLGDDASILVWGTGVAPDGVATLKFGLDALSEKFFQNHQRSVWDIQAALVEVGKVVMPCRSLLLHAGALLTTSASIAELATRAGMPDDSDEWFLSICAVEQLFNRLLEPSLGRSAPSTGRFSVALLMLRECLHRLSFDGITVLRQISRDPLPNFNSLSVGEAEGLLLAWS